MQSPPGSIHQRHRRRRPLFWGLGLVAGFLALCALAIALAPRVLDLPVVRADLERQLSRAVGGQIAFDALEVRLLPSPRGIVRGVRIEIPGTVSGRVDEIDVHLRLLPLLAGRVAVRGATIVRPVLRLSVPQPAAARSTRPFDALVAYRDVMQPLADAVRRSAPDFSLDVREGEIEVQVPGLPPFGQVGFAAQGRSDARGLEVTASATGRLLQNLKAKARLEYADLAAHAEIDGSGFKPQTLIDHFQSGAAVTVALQLGGVRAEAHTDGRTTIGGKVSAEVPALTVVRENARVDLAELRAEAAFKAQGAIVELAFEARRPGDSAPLASARLGLGGAQPQVEGSIEVPALELVRLRDLATTLAADREIVRRYVGRVRAGQLTGLRVSAQAPTLAELLDPAAIDVRAKLEGAAVLVPIIEQEAVEVAGALAWNKSALRASSVSGRIGRSRLADGAIEYRATASRARADFGYDADLAELLELARQLVPPPQRSGLDVVRGVTGRAQGRLTLAATRDAWQVDVAVARSDSVVRLRDVPWPVRLREAKLSASPRRVTVSDAVGAAGASTFSQAAIELSLAGPLRLEAGRGAATLALAEVYPWLRERPALRERLQGLKAVTGSVEVILTRAAGRLDNLDTLLYEATLRPRGIRAEIAELPAPVLVDGGSIDVRPQALRFDGVASALLDARARLSGTARNYRMDAVQLDASLADGTTGDAFVAWAWKRAGAPARLRPKTPLRFAAERVRWSREGGIDLSAAAQILDGPSVEADVAWKRDTLDVRRARIKDTESDATLSLLTRGRLLDTGFSGVLTGRSVAGLFAVSAGERTGRVEGDMRATLDRDLRGRTTARGRLTAQEIRLERLLGVPLTVERIDLDGDGARLRVNEAGIAYADQKATMRGEIRHGESGPVIDAQLDTPGIVIDRLLPSPREGAPESAAPPERTLPEALSIWPLAVTGKLAVRAGFLQYRKLRMDGVEASMTLEPERARLTVTQGVMCDVAFPLTLELTPGGAAAEVQPRAQRQRIESVVSCLTEGNTRLTGEFDVRADLRASGKPGEYLRNLAGTVELHARQGKVMKWSLLGNILALTSVSSLLTKGGPRLDETGFDYREIVVRGRFSGGRLIVDEAAFDSPALGLAAKGTVTLEDRIADLTVLVAPFGRVDWLVRKVPIVGYIFGGTFTSVPVSVRGNIYDPVVVPLGPKAVTTELAGIFERTLKLPGKMVQPPQPPAPPDPKASEPTR